MPFGINSAQGPVAGTFEGATDKVVRPRPRRPLVGVALAFALGCAIPGASERLPWLFAWGLLLLVPAVSGRPRRLSAPCLWLAILMTGVLHRALSQPGIAPADLVHQRIPDRGIRTKVVGRVARSPVCFRSSETRSEWRFPVEVESLLAVDGRWCRVRGQIEVGLPDTPDSPNDPPQFGDRVLLVGRLVPPRGAAMRFRLYADARRSRSLQKGRGWIRRSLQWRETAAAVLGRGLDNHPTEVAVMRAMLLGLRDDVPPPIRERFWMTGTMHVFAISGLHVGIVVDFGLRLIRALGVRRRHEFVVVAPLLASYVAATGLAPSAVRATLMTLAYLVAPLLGRKPDVVSALAFAAVALLAHEARQMENPGFIYSFVVVAGLLTLAPELSQWARRRLAPEPWRLEPMSERERFWRTVAARSADLLAFSMAAWLASAPLTARWANLFSPSAIAGNLVVIPLAYLLVLSGMLSILCFPVSAWLSEVFNHAGSTWAAILIRSVEGLTRVPQLQRYVSSPSWVVVFGFYAVLIGLFHLRARPRRVLLLCAVMVAAAALVHRLGDRRVTVHAMDASRGHAILLEGPRHATVLIDPGPRIRAAALVRSLRAKGINRIDTVILTQPEPHRYGALPMVAAQFPIRRIVLPGGGSKSPDGDPVWADLLARGIEILPLIRDTRIEWAGGARMRVLHPAPGQPYRRRADAALMAVWQYGPYAMLLAGSTAELPWNSLEATGAVPPLAAALVPAPLTTAALSALRKHPPAVLITRGASFDHAYLHAAAAGLESPWQWWDARAYPGTRVRFGTPPFVGETGMFIERRTAH